MSASQKTVSRCIANSMLSHKWGKWYSVGHDEATRLWMNGRRYLPQCCRGAFCLRKGNNKKLFSWQLRKGKAVKQNCKLDTSDCSHKLYDILLDKASANAYTLRNSTKLPQSSCFDTGYLLQLYSHSRSRILITQFPSAFSLGHLIPQVLFTVRNMTESVNTTRPNSLSRALPRGLDTHDDSMFWYQNTEEQ